MKLLPAALACSLLALSCAGSGVPRTEAPATDSPPEASARPPRPDERRDLGLSPLEMRRWFRGTTPGRAHRALGHLVGSWDAEGKVWVSAEAAPLALTGGSENRWILAGRFVETRFRGEAHGLVFEGRGTEGYDNVAERYAGTWQDTLSTTVLCFAGQLEGTVRTMTAETLDPLTGEAITVRGVTTRLRDDAYTYEAWAERPDGERWKTLEIRFTRRAEE